MQLLLPVSPMAKAQTRAAERPVRGKALKIGLLDNTKPNGDAIVQSVFDALAAEGIGGEAILYAKRHAGEGVKPELFAKLAQCDLVLTALAN